MKNLNYILMVLLGGALYGTMSSFVKLSYSRGFNAAELAFSQALLAAVILSLVTFLTSCKLHKPQISIAKLLPFVLTGGAIGLTNYFYYLSVNYINASMAIVILMQFTWFSLLLEWLFFHKKPSCLELITVFFILCGTVMASNLFYGQAVPLSIKGVMFALVSSFTYAVYIVANGRLGQHVRWQLKSILIMTGSALVIFLINYQTIMTENHFGYDFMPWAIFLAVVGTAIPTALFAIGIPKIGAGISSILMTVELPVAVLCAHLILQEQINSLQLIGIVLMLIAISAMNFLKSNTSKPSKVAYIKHH